MPLPFLKNKKEASASAPVESIQRKPDEEANEYDVLEAAAEDLMNAIYSKDVKAIAAALKAAFQLCETSEEEEGEHVDG